MILRISIIIVICIILAAAYYYTHWENVYKFRILEQGEYFKLQVRPKFLPFWSENVDVFTYGLIKRSYTGNKLHSKDFNHIIKAIETHFVYINNIKNKKYHYINKN